MNSKIFYLVSHKSFEQKAIKLISMDSREIKKIVCELHIDNKSVVGYVLKKGT